MYLTYFIFDFLIKTYKNIFYKNNFNSVKFKNLKKNIKFKKVYILYKLNKLKIENNYKLLYIYIMNFKFNYIIYITILLKLNYLDNINQIYNKNEIFLKKNLIFLKNKKLLNNFINFSLKKINNNLKIKNFMFLNLKNTYNYYIKYSVTDFFKYLNNKSLWSINIMYLRKNKIFNKGRYSRNRQYYRTGVYWCLYINIIAVVGLYFWFYRFNMNFGYLWWILYIFIFSIFFSRLNSLNLFNVNKLLNQIIKSFIWYFNIIFSFVINFKNYIIKIF